VKRQNNLSVFIYISFETRSRRKALTGRYATEAILGKLGRDWRELCRAVRMGLDVLAIGLKSVAWAIS
jgi:hypothetical protein